MKLYGQYELRVEARDSEGTQEAIHYKLYTTDIDHYDLILGMEWLWKADPSIQFRTGCWTYRNAPIQQEQRLVQHKGRLPSPLHEEIPQAALGQGPESEAEPVHIQRVTLRELTEDENKVYCMWYHPIPQEQGGDPRIH